MTDMTPRLPPVRDCVLLLGRWVQPHLALSGSHTSCSPSWDSPLVNWEEGLRQPLLHGSDRNKLTDVCLSLSLDFTSETHSLMQWVCRLHPFCS